MKNIALAITSILLFAACGGGSDAPAPPVVAPPPTPPPVTTPPPSNVNISNPTQTTFDNGEVSQGGALTLVWSDEFSAAQLDPETWFFESGDGSQYGIPGWGNNEQQWYLENNAALSNGILTLTAKEESQNGFAFTSARLLTRDRVAVRYGRIEASIRLPGGQGVWPAFWMLPQDFAYGGWAASGEIDIMEAVNLDASGGNNIVGSIHYGGEFPENVYTSEWTTVSGSATGEFHEYAIEWDANEIRWYVDDVLYSTKTSWYSTSAVYPAPFNQPFYILLNVAVGGNFPGPPNASTVFPVTMDVDYVRVYSGSP